MPHFVDPSIVHVPEHENGQFAHLMCLQFKPLEQKLSSHSTASTVCASREKNNRDVGTDSDRQKNACCMLDLTILRI